MHVPTDALTNGYAWNDAKPDDGTRNDASIAALTIAARPVVDVPLPTIWRKSYPGRLEKGLWPLRKRRQVPQQGPSPIR